MSLGNKQEHEIANHAIQASARCMVQAAGLMPHNGARVSMATGCSIATLSFVAVLLDEQGPGDVLVDDPDMVIFGAVYTICSVEKATGGLIAGFSIDILAKALSMFKEITGREYTNIASELLQQIKEHQDQARNVPINLQKFVN